MTSSFHDKQRGASLAVAVLIVTCFVSLPGSTVAGDERAAPFVVAQIAPDAPRSARPQIPAIELPTSRPNPRTPVELKSVVVRPLDDAMRNVAGRPFLRRATDPLYIQVETEAPLGNLERAAAPVIILNGDKLIETQAIAKDKLVAFLPDHQKLKDVNTIEVVWLGDQATRTTKPLTLRREDVGR